MTDNLDPRFARIVADLGLTPGEFTDAVARAKPSPEELRVYRTRLAELRESAKAGDRLARMILVEYDTAVYAGDRPDRALATAEMLVRKAWEAA